MPMVLLAAGAPFLPADKRLENSGYAHWRWPAGHHRAVIANKPDAGAFSFSDMALLPE
jgi:hypothetical protein